jgi:alginate O-acetyltransferase complex protein AlgI
MLFNSKIFLFAFLPITFSVFFGLGRNSKLLAQIWLALASLFFYAWWNPPYLVLLLVSATINYGVGQALQARADATSPAARDKALLAAGLAFNLVALGYFKYFAFLLGIFKDLSGYRLDAGHIILPLGISFFTFQKIAYLVDSYTGRIKERSFLNYILFVSFFPQLIAGPIVHYSQVFPQFKDPLTYKINSSNVIAGLTIFLLGLAKKVVLADEFARSANAGFESAANGTNLSLVAAWIAALGYTLQLYFDFSGYSDMAIGLGRMFNIQLPLNFDSPYKASSIIEFWRRWHMTLSRFLRDYVYIPLGGNRGTAAHRYVNLLLTMVVGGLWHGAAWTFVLWGALHGVYLLINHFWRAMIGNTDFGRAGIVAAHAITLLAVIVAWVLFRSPDIPSALRLYKGMLGANGAELPEQVLALVPWLRHGFLGVGYVAGLADSTVMGTIVSLMMLGTGLGIVLIAPAMHEMSPRLRLFLLALSFAFSLQRILFSSEISPFLYFQF